MKAYTTREWYGSHQAPPLGDGIIIVDSCEKTGFQRTISRDDAIRLADEIYEKLGLGIREGGYRPSKPELEVHLTDLGIRTKERDEALRERDELRSENERLARLEGDLDEARIRRNDYRDLYERANQKVHEKDSEITGLIAKLATSEKESAEKSKRIFELCLENPRSASPDNSAAQNWRNLVELLGLPGPEKR
jgi:DNA repair exonuclease SbcCD ATPase subunit